MKSFVCLVLLISTLVIIDAASVVDKNIARQAPGIMSFFTGGQRVTPRPSQSSPASESTATNSLSGLANLASGIQSVPSLQSILDASGITRLTDPVYNQVRKRWQAIVNR